ncbi:ash family protein [Mangrovibacter phragmitis]|nr:ash family protein [Mangrovibacter phragmitis]
MLLRVLCVATSLTQIMVGCAGEPKGSPGSLIAGSLNSVQPTTSKD